MDTESYCPRAAIFDLYGTLIYEDPDSVVLQHRLAAFLAVDPVEFLAARERTLHEAMVGTHADTVHRARAVLHLLNYPGIDPAAERLATEEERLRRESVRVSPGGKETLAALRSLGLRIGAASNCTNIWRIFLDALEMEPYFDAIGISCELGRCKPEPELFLWVTERLGVEPEECVYIGDGDGGEMEAARDLGMTAVLIDQPWSWVRATGRSVYYDRKISHLGELLRIVAGSS